MVSKCSGCGLLLPVLLSDHGGFQPHDLFVDSYPLSRAHFRDTITPSPPLPFHILPPSPSPPSAAQAIELLYSGQVIPSIQSEQRMRKDALMWDRRAEKFGHMSEHILPD